VNELSKYAILIPPLYGLTSAQKATKVPKLPEIGIP